MNKYPNVYETVIEAEIRLKDTVILYKGEPYYVYCISDHFPDGIFRIYMSKTGYPMGLPSNRHSAFPSQYNEDELFGEALDRFIATYPVANITRKKMNSPYFNRFRPFKLGMVNDMGTSYYIRRTPRRHTQQGLTMAMLTSEPVGFASKTILGRPYAPDIFSSSVANCIRGEYPEASEVVEALKDPEVTNSAIAFHREFAIVRGPLSSLLLAYRENCIGILRNNDLTELALGPDKAYLKEAVEGLGVFSVVSTID